MNFNYFINRSKDILINPENEWPKINTENKNIYFYSNNILIPFSILLALASVIGSVIFDHNNFGTGINYIYLSFLAVKTFLLFFLGSYASIYILNELLPNFNNTKDINKASSIVINTLIAYYTTSLFSYLLPQLSILFTVLAFYTVYIFCVGVRISLKIPREKQIGFIIISSLIIILIFFFLRLILGSLLLLITSSELLF